MSLDLCTFCSSFNTYQYNLLMIDLLKFDCLCRSIFFFVFTTKYHFVTVLNDYDYGHVLHAMRIKLVRSRKKLGGAKNVSKTFN